MTTRDPLEKPLRTLAPSLLLLSLAALAACTTPSASPPSERADPTSQPAPSPPAREEETAESLARTEISLTARFERVRAALEAELGASFDPAPRFVPATRDELSRVMIDEGEWIYSSVELGPDADERRRQAGIEGGVVLGKLDLSTGRVLIVAHGFRRLREQTGQTSPELLDLILIHEAVHAWQWQHLGLEALFRNHTREDRIQALRYLTEGHAHLLTRRVAERLGLDATFGRFVETRPSYELEGERFVTAVLARLGEREGLDRLFRQPPRSVREVRWPECYLDPPAVQTDVDVEALARQATRAIRNVSAKWDPFVVFGPDIALGMVSGLRDLGVEEAEAWLRDGWLDAVAVRCTDSTRPMSSLSLNLTSCASPERARELLGLQLRFARMADDRHDDVVACREEQVDGRPALFVERAVKVAGAPDPRPNRWLSVVDGTVVIELFSSNDLGEAALQALARQLFAKR